MRGMMKKVAVAVGLCWVVASAAPEVEFSGYLDADVWADMTGNYFANSELDLGMGLKFSDKVAAHVYATVWSIYDMASPGSIPAGYGSPSGRWLNMKFDGFDITFETGAGTFAVGDLVYQYGKFNYYLYKRLSMITNESFSRGVQYSVGGDMFSQQLLFGVSDLGNTITDVQGVSKLAFSDALSLDVYYGMQNDWMTEFKMGSDFYAGAEFLGSFGDMFALKFDLGYKNLAGEDRSNVLSLLLEPTLTAGNFSTALTAFYMSDGDENANGGDMLGIMDEMFFYVEPGYSFTDNFAAGLPIEYHAKDLENENDNEFWLVPTLYIYPFENVQWWLWGQFAKPLADGADMYFGAGSEIIVEF
jgi:hypothetical protein